MTSTGSVFLEFTECRAPLLKKDLSGTPLCLLDAVNLDEYVRRARDLVQQSDARAPVMRLHTLPSDLPTAGSIGVLSQPRAIASLVYDMWLLNAAVGAVIQSRDNAGLAAETESLLTRRGLHVLTDVVDLHNTLNITSTVAVG